MKVSMADVLPESTSGKARIEHFTVSPEAEQYGRLRALSGHGRDFVPAGRYARLYIERTLWMSDTPAEWEDLDEVLDRARGDVLIGGLGMGMLVTALLQCPRVRTVTVIEINPDVIALVEPHLRRFLHEVVYPARGATVNLCVFQGDITTWVRPRGHRYDTIFFDIWATISASHYPAMMVLHKRLRPALRPRGFMTSWALDDCKHARW